MPISTDLSGSPYYDDYSDQKNYHRILFKPSVAVQVRELNQLQNILQRQVERFGDNIYKKGTIIEGCNFVFHPVLNYVKINDVQTDGAPVNVTSFKGFYAKNSNNIIAQIIETSSGFQATPPDLNTLHVKYLNTGTSGNGYSFSRNDVLTIYDPSYIVSETDVVVKSTGFSNNDNVVILSAIEVTNTTGGNVFVNSSGQACTFTVGEIITETVGGAKAQIMEVNTTANVQTTILKIRPLASNLRLANTRSWFFVEGRQFTTSDSNITSILNKKIGSGAIGTLVTDSEGGLNTIAVLKPGTGYYVEPWITVAYRTPNTSSIANAAIDAVRVSSKNYLCNVTINNAVAAIGFGTGIAVSEGIIYQKGHFVRVDDQFIVVDKYNRFTNNVVGFDTIEEIIDFREDVSLLDNAIGSFNEKAPGADRLKLTPVLTSISKELASANDTFLPIIEYNLGKPAIQRTGTEFNSIEKELAKRTYEESGNYVLDQFLITTNDIDDISQSALAFRATTDPGTAYIQGYRVQTFAPLITDITKSIQTITRDTSVSIDYGNYIVVDEFAGFFNFTVGDLISLRDTAKTYISSSTSSTGSNQFPDITAAGTQIGTAKIRSVQIQRGIHGGATTRYRIYLFDVRMARGKNFRNVRSVFYNQASDKGVADIVLNANNQAQLYGVRNSSLLFPTGMSAIKSINSISYTYRTTNRTLTLGADGIITVSVASVPGEHFDYTSLLTADEKESITLIPLANTQATVNAVGQVLVTGPVANLIGVGTSFRTDFDPGDYIKVANSGGNFEIKRIVKISNATHITVDSAFTNTLGTANAVLFFPRNIPIPLGFPSDSRRTANVQSNTTLSINVGNTLTTAVSAILSYDVRRSTNSIAKKVIRKALVKIDTGTNEGNTVGPWCLGVPDIFRIRQVYEGKTVVFEGNSSIVNSTSDFITFTNDFLTDGEIVIYRTASGNAAISGLTNNQSYYVVSANSSGVKLSTTTGGTAVDLTSTTGNTTQYLLTVSKDDKRVGANFYIDHNQRKDYYDVGYLYTRKSINYSVPSNKLLLVEYDVLTQNNREGLKTITSYPINDFVGINRNTNGIHTLEIPEVLHDNGDYYDLRDTLDFRPQTTNTVIITTDVNAAPVNPAEPTEINRFDNQNKRFPSPGSVCDMTVERYLPRIDSLVLLSNTDIKVVQGEYDESPRPPKIDNEGLLLNHLIIPPYPSLPQNLSRTIFQYLNTGVLNVSGASKKRRKNYTIRTPITADGLKFIQSKPYTMQDIASLERRIADLEYYTSLSFTEDRVSGLNLPSSLNSAVNRFKFGFFVDNFKNANYADINDPAYYAQIYGYELNPVKLQVRIDYIFLRSTVIS